MSVLHKNPFIAAVLAPLPEGEDPVMTKQFRSDLKADLKYEWQGLFAAVEAAESAYEAKRNARYLSRFRMHVVCDRADVEEKLLEADLASAVMKLMKFPAVTKDNLTYKKRHRRQLGGCPEWEAAIKADEERLSSG